MSYDPLLQKLRSLREVATPPPWKVDPEDMMGPRGDWGIYHVESGGQIFYVGDPYPRGDNNPAENCALAAAAHEMSACAEALVALLDDDSGAFQNGLDALDALAKALGCEVPV